MFRPLEVKDLYHLREIHERHYNAEFAFPDFDKFFTSFIVENEKGLILGGGIRNIQEIVVITDKDFPPKTRVNALLSVLDHYSYKQIHAFIQDPNWAEQLKEFGFRDTKGRAMIYG